MAVDREILLKEGHFIDDDNSKIYLTSDFKKKASVYGSKERELLKNLEKDYPKTQFEYIVKSLRSSTPDNKRISLTWDLMFKTAETEKKEELLKKLRELKDSEGGLPAYHEAKKLYKKTLNRDERNQKVKDNSKPKAKTTKKATATEEATTETAE